MDFRKKLEELRDQENGEIMDRDLAQYSKELYRSRLEIPALFRFQPANYNNIRALEMDQVFLVPAGDMNDAFEGLSSATGDDVRNHLGELRDLIYLKSFSEVGFEDNMLMWGNYADNFKGFCVEYDMTDMRGLLLSLLPGELSQRKVSREMHFSARSQGFHVI